MKKKKTVRKNNSKLFLELHNVIKVECSYVYLKQRNIFKVLEWIKGKWKLVYSFQGVESKGFIDYRTGKKGDNYKAPHEFIPSIQQWSDIEERISQIISKDVGI